MIVKLAQKCQEVSKYRIMTARGACGVPCATECREDALVYAVISHAYVS